MNKHGAILVSGGLLILMTALMATPIREESATMDEGVFLAAGYNYWHGLGFNFDPEAPPLAKMISATPLLFLDVKLPPEAQQLLTRQVGSTVTCRWSGEKLLVDEGFPVARDNWYFWPVVEAQTAGQAFLYGGANDATRLLAAGRWMQVALMVLTGIVIFFWLRRLAGDAAGALGVALWSLNPVALAYGHLVLTDMGETLLFVLAVWGFTVLLERPSAGRAVLCGLACGGALVMKFSAVVLAPILLVLMGLEAMPKRQWRGWGKHLAVMALAAGGVVLLVYAPYWTPAPPLSPEQATRLGVPAWFQLLRPVLIPPDFFKGLALVAGHESAGHISYLWGQWRRTGWWYYFPVAMAVKTPLPLLALTAVGLGLWLRGLRRFSFPQAAPWLAALIYLVFAMVGTIDIGVRHLLPMFALLAVGSASQFGLRSRRVQLCAWLGIGWLLVVTWRARPHFIEYFNEAAGGPPNGYRWLVDSNLDWGQDAKRLKHFLDEQGITNADLACFGPRRSIGYYGISGRRITSGEARGIHSGTLIISASVLVSPPWDWLRACHEPVARIGYTMFVYHLGDPETKERWERMLRINPHDARAHYNLAIILERTGQPLAAIAHYEKALRIQPDYTMAHYNLAETLEQVGRVSEAIEHYQQALRISPGFAEAHYNLATALLAMGNGQEAAKHLERFVELNPDSAQAQYCLAEASNQTGRSREAIGHYEQALQLQPGFADAYNNLAWLLATHTPAEGGDAVRAVGLAQRACELTGDRRAGYLDTLAAAYAAAGQFREAVATAQEAVELARAAGRPKLAGEVEARLELYRSGRAYFQPVGNEESKRPLTGPSSR